MQTTNFLKKIPTQTNIMIKNESSYLLVIKWTWFTWFCSKIELKELEMFWEVFEQMKETGKLSFCFCICSWRIGS